MQKKLKVIKKSTFYEVCGKRILDLTITIPALLLASPIFLIIGIFIKLDSQGSIIYKQKRAGKNKKEFSIYKFRTMVSNADKIGPNSTTPGDNRITKIGKILRQTSLDELPQLVNVLINDMSLVGYRPGLKDTEIKKDNSGLYKLKPGITGYAQINGRSDLNKEEKRNWELRYLDDVSLLTDIKVLFKTVGVILLGKGSY